MEKSKYREYKKGDSPEMVESNIYKCRVCGTSKSWVWVFERKYEDDIPTCGKCKNKENLGEINNENVKN